MKNIKTSHDSHRHVSMFRDNVKNFAGDNLTAEEFDVVADEYFYQPESTANAVRVLLNEFSKGRDIFISTIESTNAHFNQNRVKVQKRSELLLKPKM